LSLDWVDNHFFTEDKRYLICANHGATYEPATGECVWGPCTGAFLQSVPLAIRDKTIFAFCPDGESPEARARAVGKGETK
jgi:nitrite reductase/ring-hydroxylating ferredoxin subunit